MTFGRFHVERCILPLLAALILAAPRTARADDCPAGTVQVGEKRTETADAIIVQPICKKVAAVPTKCPPGWSVVNSICQQVTPLQSERDGRAVVNLALNPHLAEIDRIELREVEGLMARLHKELEILQERDEDAAKDGKELHAEMVKQDHEIDWQAFLFATAGLGEVLKLASSNYVEAAEAIQQDSIWGELPIEKANLQKMLASAHGQDAEALTETIDALDRVEHAHKLKDTVETGEKLQEAMVVENEEMQRLASLDRRTADLLYESSAFMGRTAIIFGKGVVEKCSAVASFAEPFAEASAVYLMMGEEEQQMKQLSNRLADRQTMRRQINEQLGKLENRQQTLQWAIQRADPSISKGN